MKIFDTHTHYDDEAFDSDREALLASLGTEGDDGICVEKIVNVGASMRGVRDSMALARSHEGVYAACGLHPDHIGELTDRVCEELKRLCADEKCVAVGEIGLDYHWMVEEKEKQQEGFIKQLELAKEVSLPVNIHSRDAAQDTFDILKSHHFGSTGGIIHCFSGSAEMAAEYVKAGYYIGIGGVVTFKNARTLVSVVERIPIEHLVTETDCPYLAPVPHRGERNFSWHLGLVVEKIASIKGMDVSEAADILYENGKRVYRL